MPSGEGERGPGGGEGFLAQRVGGGGVALSLLHVSSIAKIQKVSSLEKSPVLQDGKQTIPNQRPLNKRCFRIVRENF